MAFRKRRDRGFSVSIREGTAGDLEDLLAAAAASSTPGRWFGGGLAQFGIRDGDEVDPEVARGLFLRGTAPGAAAAAATPAQDEPASRAGRRLSRWLDRSRPRGRESSGVTGDSGGGREVLERVMARQDPQRWRHGTWAERDWPADGLAALEGLEPFLGYPNGGRGQLDLPGWDDCSIWGYDPQNDCYFAQLWHNRDDDEDSPDEPDIWIQGWDTIDGRPYVVTTTRVLAHEIAAATGCSLAAVCAALAAGMRVYGSATHVERPGWQ